MKKSYKNLRNFASHVILAQEVIMSGKKGQGAQKGKRQKAKDCSYEVSKPDKKALPRFIEACRGVIQIVVPVCFHCQGFGDIFFEGKNILRPGFFDQTCPICGRSFDFYCRIGLTYVKTYNPNEELCKKHIDLNHIRSLNALITVFYPNHAAPVTHLCEGTIYIVPICPHCPSYGSIWLKNDPIGYEMLGQECPNCGHSPMLYLEVGICYLYWYNADRIADLLIPPAIQELLPFKYIEG
jgi:hypothetical protein